jgi:hypothetical protein
MLDPFVTALATALEEVVRRGVKVTPTEGGWLVKIAAEATPQAAPASDEDEFGRPRRSW